MSTIRERLGLKEDDYYVQKRKINQSVKQNKYEQKKLTQQIGQEYKSLGIKPTSEIANETMKSSSIFNNVNTPSSITINQSKVAENKIKETLNKEKQYQLTSPTYKKLKDTENTGNLLEYLKNYSDVEEEGVSTLDKFNILRPYKIGLDNTFNQNSVYIDENGKKIYLPSKQQIKQNAVNEELGNFGKSIHSASESLGSMTPAMAVGMLPVPGARVLASGMTFATVANNSKNQKLLEGYTEDQARNFALIDAGLETFLGNVLGGSTKILGGESSMLSKALGKVAGKVFKSEGVNYFVSHLASEEIEELMQMVLEPINEHVTLGEHDNIQDALSTLSGDEAIITALSTLITMGITEGPTAIQVGKLQKNIDKINQEYGTDLKVKNIETNENTLTETTNDIRTDDNEIINATNTRVQDNIDVNTELNNVSTKIQEQVNEVSTALTTNNITSEVAQQKIAELQEDVDVLRQWNESQVEKENIEINKEQTAKIDVLKSQITALQEQIGQRNINLPPMEKPSSKVAKINLPSSQSNLSFEQQADNVIKGIYPKRDMLVVSKETPKILQDLGLNNLPITMTQKHLNSIMNEKGTNLNVNYHNLGENVVKQLPKAIQQPLNVLKSSTKDDSIVVVTELSDKNNNIVVASIKIDGKGQISDIQINSNVMTSAYGKSGNYDNFMRNNIAKGNLLYDIDEGIVQTINKQKKESDVTDRVQFPMRDSSRKTTSDIPKNISPITDNNIPQSNTNVKLSPAIINNNMQESENNTTKLPIKEETKLPTAELLDKRPARQKTTTKDSYNKTIQQIVNKGHYVDQLARKTGNMELTYKYDKMLGSQAEGHYSIGIAQTDNKGKKIGKSILDIWKPVEDANKVEDFSLYLLHKHNIDRWNQGKPVFGEAVTSDMSQVIVNEYEKSNPEFKEWAKDINTYNKNQLQNMVDAGLTSEDGQQYLNDTYTNYVKIYRDITGNSPLTQYKGNLKVNVPIKKARGGNQNILPLKDSMAQQTIEVKNAIRRNDFGLELLKVLDNGENTTFDGKQTVVKNDDGSYGFTVFKNGNPIKMEIDEGLYESIKPTEIKAWEQTLPFQAVQKASKIQRSLLTIDNPLFIATNFFKDLGDAPFNSKYTSKFFRSYIKALNQLATKGELYQQYMANGGNQNTYFDYNEGIKMPTNNKLKKFIEGVRMLNEFIEQAPRLAEYISTIESGGSITEAMYNSAEITTNFKRGGDLTKAINRNGANFLNASIQGFDKQIRNLTGQKVVKGYISLLAKATIFGVLPSVLNHLLYDDDEDYLDLPGYIKDTYYLFKIENGKFLRIPKGRATSIFGDVARRTLENDWKGFGDTVVNQMAPNNPLQDNIIAPITQAISNKSWNGSEIVPQRLQDELRKNQYDEKTDIFSKWLGGITNISPKKINYVLDQYSGGIGDILLPLLTPQAESGPLSSKFTVDSVLTNKNVNDFFDKTDELNKIKNDSNASDDDILKSKYMESISKEVNDLYKEKRDIQNSDLKDKEKKEEVRKIQQDINNIMKSALDTYENVDSSDSFATVEDMSFYRDKNGEWTKISSNEDKDKQIKIAINTGMNMDEYIKYKNTEFLSDKDSSGKSITNSRKKKIANFVDDLDLSLPEKAIIIKMEYPSFDDYNSQIVNRIKQQKISEQEKKDILTELGFKIKNGKVYW